MLSPADLADHIETALDALTGSEPLILPQVRAREVLAYLRRLSAIAFPSTSPTSTYDRRRAAGLCAECGAPSPNLSRCTACREKRRQRRSV